MVARVLPAQTKTDGVTVDTPIRTSHAADLAIRGASHVLKSRRQQSPAMRRPLYPTSKERRNLMIKCALLALLLLSVVPTPAMAGMAEGSAAYAKGDYVTALQEWRPLADQGNAAAQARLGVMYETGKGLPVDYAQAAKWFRLAADRGDVLGEANLGFMYYGGLGIPQDYLQAYKWFSLAARQGNVEAANNRNTIAAEMTPAQIAEAEKLASGGK